MMHLARLLGLNPGDRSEWPIDLMERILLDADDAGMIRMEERVRQALGVGCYGPNMGAYEVSQRMAENITASDIKSRERDYFAQKTAHRANPFARLPDQSLIIAKRIMPDKKEV